MKIRSGIPFDQSVMLDSLLKVSQAAYLWIDSTYQVLYFSSNITKHIPSLFTSKPKPGVSYFSFLSPELSNKHKMSNAGGGLIDRSDYLVTNEHSGLVNEIQVRKASNEIWLVIISEIPVQVFLANQMKSFDKSDLTASPDWAFTLDGDLNFNEVYGRYPLGPDRFTTDLKGKNISNFVQKEKVGQFYEVIEKARKKTFSSFDWEYKDKSCVIYFKSRVYPMNQLGRGSDEILITCKDISEITLIQNQLSENQNFLNTIINHTPLTIFAKDKKGRYTLVNDYFCRILQRKREDIIGKTIRSLQKGSFADKIKQQDASVIKKGQPDRHEVWLKNKHDKQVLMDTVKIPLIQPTGEVSGLIGIGRNITKIRDIEQRLKLALEIGKEIVMEWDLVKNDVVFSANFYRTLNYEPGSLDGHFLSAFKRLVHRDDIANVINLMRGFFKHKKGLFECEVRLKDSEGEYRWFIARGQVTVRDPKGRPYAAVFILIDVTEIKSLQVELKNYNLQLSQLIGSVPGVVFTCQLQKSQKLSFISSKCIDVFGYSDQELMSEKPHFRSLSNGDYDKVVKEIEWAVGDKREYEVRYQVTQKGGKRIWIWEKGRFRKIHGKHGVFLIDGIMMDITESMEIEERIQMASIKAEEKERRRLAHDIHDSVQQMLISSLFQLRSLEDEVSGLKEGSLEKFNRGISYVDDAIKEARSISHNLVPNAIYDYGLTETIRGLINDMEMTHDFRILFKENIKESRFDEMIELNIYRVVQESINNIIKYAQAKKVTIHLTVDHGEFKGIIADDGRGFDLGKIDQRNSIGISSMQYRITSMNGKFKIESRPGEGCEIIFSIPIRSST